MTVILADRVRETTAVVGTGPATLLGAVVGYQSFSVVGNANLCYYTIADQAGANWEVGIGTYATSGSTLTRTTILSSSNSGSAVNFTAGTKDVFLTQPAEKAVTTQSLYTPDTFAGTFVAGVAIDYVSPNGRISVGTAGTLTFYTGGVGSTAMASMTSTGINSTAIGATTASTGAFTTLSASSTVSGTGFSTYLASPPAIGTTTPSTGSFTTLGATGAITANTTTNNQSYTTTGAGTITLTSGTTGSINNFNIGATTAGTGAFTTLSASSTVSGTGFSNWLTSQLTAPPPIGGTTPNTGAFTSLSLNGTSGITFSDASAQNTAATGFGFKNRIINGSCVVAQRGNVAVSTNTSTYGGCDRFRLLSSGFSTISGTLGQSGSIGSGSSVSGYVQQFGPVTTTGSGTITISQRIESLYSVDLNGSAITISLSLYQDTGSTLSPTINIYKANSQDNFSATTFVNGSAVSLPSGVRTSFTYTLTLGATDASNGIELVINLPFGAVTNKYFQLDNVQLEKSPTATSFDYRPYGTELALCQRYYQTAGGINGGYAGTAGAGAGYSSLNFPVQMRTGPTIVFTPSGGGNYTSVTGTASGGTTLIMTTTATAVGNFAFNYSYTAAAEL